MRQSLAYAQQTGLSGPVAFGVGLLLLALAPLIRGGNRYVALIGLEWLGLLVLWLLAMWGLLGRNRAAQAYDTAPLSKGEWALILSPLWAALLFLTPLSMGLWAALPGHQLYLNAPDMGWRPLSLTPDSTVASLLAGIPVVAAFLFARTVQPVLFRLLVCGGAGGPRAAGGPTPQPASGGCALVAGAAHVVGGGAGFGFAHGCDHRVAGHAADRVVAYRWHLRIIATLVRAGGRGIAAGGIGGRWCEWLCDTFRYRPSG